MKKITIALMIIMGNFIEGSQQPSQKSAFGWGALKGFLQGAVYAATGLETIKIVDSAVCFSKYGTFIGLGAVLNSGCKGFNFARHCASVAPVQETKLVQSPSVSDNNPFRRDNNNPKWATAPESSSASVTRSCYKKSAQKELLIFVLSGAVALGYGYYNGSTPENMLRLGLITNFTIKGADIGLSRIYS